MNIIQITETGAIKVWHERFPSDTRELKGTLLSASGDVVEFFRGRINVVSGEGDRSGAIVNDQVLLAFKRGTRIDDVVRMLEQLTGHYRQRLEEMLGPRPGFDLDA